MGVCFKGYDVIVKLFIENGVNVNVKNYNGVMVLIYVMMFIKIFILKLFLEYNVDIFIKDDSGKIVLDYVKM